MPEDQLTLQRLVIIEDFSLRLLSPDEEQAAFLFQRAVTDAAVFSIESARSMGASIVLASHNERLAELLKLPLDPPDEHLVLTNSDALLVALPLDEDFLFFFATPLINPNPSPPLTKPYEHHHYLGLYRLPAQTRTYQLGLFGPQLPGPCRQPLPGGGNHLVRRSGLWKTR